MSTHKLKNIKILLGITGSIAAYKCCELVRLMVKQGAIVRVVMTENATQFVAPISLQTVSSYPVRIKLFNQQSESAMSHIEMAKWADLLLIAPASADIIAKISHGIADNLLSTIWLASNAKKIIAPAMNQQMWNAKAIQRNIVTLLNDEIKIIGPAQGEQACGDNGFGRMSEVNEIVNSVVQNALVEDSLIINNDLDLKSLTIMITAGPTIEEIDPVRYISNYSSGKMGYAIAAEAINAGAKVILVSGPCHIKKPIVTNFINVTTAQQMLNKVLEEIHDVDIFIGCAAVADYRVEKKSQHKIKKDTDKLNINLVKNPDIIKHVVDITDNEKILTIAFAAETKDLEKNAKQKLVKKGVSLIAANRVGKTKEGINLAFNQDDNELMLYWKDGYEHLQKTEKSILAKKLLKRIKKQYNKEIKRKF